MWTTQTQTKINFDGWEDAKEFELELFELKVVAFNETNAVVVSAKNEGGPPVWIELEPGDEKKIGYSMYKERERGGG